MPEILVTLNLQFGFVIEYDVTQQSYMATMAISAEEGGYLKRIPVDREDSSEWVMAHMLDSFKLNTYKSWSHFDKSPKIKYIDVNRI